MKQKLRQQIIQKINLMKEEEIVKKSKKVIKKLNNLEVFKRSKNICVYISKKDEVFTHNLIQSLLKNKNVFVPYVEKDTLKISQIKNFSDLEKGTFDIFEPKLKIEFNGKIDLVIVPGVAFDKNCGRLGRGNGYYDKFLRDKDFLKIALAFDEQILDKVPMGNHDISMDIVITENQFFEKGAE